MFRIASTRHLQNASTPAIASLIAPQVMGPRCRPTPFVDIESQSGPVKETPIRCLTKNKTITLREAVDQLIGVANATRADAVAAPSIGLDARMVAIRTNIDTRVLINPVVTRTSQPTSTFWDVDGDFVYRVVRPRNVAVKYTTTEGDEEEWCNMAAAESVAIQRAIDALDGVSTVEHLSPCVALQPSLYPEVVKNGLVGIVPRSMFNAYKGHLSLLVDTKHVQQLA